jgi:hypothetical protein
VAGASAATATCDRHRLATLRERGSSTTPQTNVAVFGGESPVGQPRRLFVVLRIAKPNAGTAQIRASFNGQRPRTAASSQSSKPTRSTNEIARMIT